MSGTETRKVAVDALVRIESQGAYANLLLNSVLERSMLSGRDRGLITELVYGVTRMRRACDHLSDPHLRRPLDPETQAALRVGVYQLAFLKQPAHAAVSTAVAAAPRRSSGLVNAVLRKVSAGLSRGDLDRGSLAVRLSYPDWIVDLLSEDLGEEAAVGALEAMNEPGEVTTRADGYIQDLGSQWTADAVEGQSGELIFDMCAAPGGKATALAATGAHVVAADINPTRLALVAANVARLGSSMSLMANDGALTSIRDQVFDRVLVDAPCSGLGVLHRRADARWRIQPSTVTELAEIQLGLVAEAVRVLKPGGVLALSVCTLSRAETIEVDERLAKMYPDLEVLPIPQGPWQAWGRGAMLLPQSAGTDGMTMHRYRLAS